MLLDSMGMSAFVIRVNYKVIASDNRWRMSNIKIYILIVRMFTRGDK